MCTYMYRICAHVNVEGMKEGHQNIPLLRTTHVENKPTNVS